MNLLDGDSDEDVRFTINENYAQRYDKWRQNEELQKLKDKYGDDKETEDSSSEDEDEDARELTEEVEKDFFRTLSCLKEKNPKIYDQNVKFFKSQPLLKNEKKEKKKKSNDFFSVGEYQRKILLEKGGQLSDEEDAEKSVNEMSNVEQEKAIKDSFKDVLKDSDNEDEVEEWGGLFKKRIKTQEELKAEEDDYKLWLAGEKKKLKNSAEEKELKGLRDYWTNPTLDEGEQFLRDYILNKRFLENEEKDRIPAYDEIVHDSDSGLSADETTLQQQEDFERKYNFRFEEPDQEFIKRYPRVLEQSMRKKDDRRKKHREEVKARKEAEKAKKVEELKRLKALKRKEIMEKIKKLQEITGNEDMGFQKNDLEDEFDPDEHDKRMSELFDETYYGTCGDEEKPEYPDLDEQLEIENWDEWGKGGNDDTAEKEELHCEDPEFNMDCDYDPAKAKLQRELMESSKKRKKRRQSKFAAAVAREKPKFDPKDKTFEKYIDEYYSLDYEDLIGDLPCRFKYRKVVPNDFGLTVEEILAAPDKELNSWVSVKKIMQRRPENVELYDVKAYKRKAADFNKKKKCLPSLYAPTSEEEVENKSEVIGTEEANVKGNKTKHKKRKHDSESKGTESSTEHSEKKKHKNNGRAEKTDIVLEKLQNETSECPVKKRKKKKKDKDVNREKEARIEVRNGVKEFVKSKTKKKKKNLVQAQGFGEENQKPKTIKNDEDLVLSISDKRLKSYGLNPKKLKNKVKFGGKNKQV